MAELSSYKALLFDVDHTLANSQRVVPETLRELLTRLHQNGYQIGVCTGRSFSALQRYVLTYFPTDAWHVVSGGSQVVTTQGQVVWEQLISGSVAQRLCQDLESAGAEYYFVAKNDALYASPKYLVNLQQHPWQIAVRPIGELENWDAALINVLEVNDHIREAVKQYQSELVIKEMPYQQTKTYFDMTAHQVTKALGIQAWCDITGLPASDIIGFGDSVNDLEFLKKVGYAVVMGNGNPELKAIADRVIGAADDDGLVTYLTDILKGQPL